MERSRPKAIVLAAIVFALACESSINSPLDERGASPRRPVVASNHITLVAGQTSLLAGDVTSRKIEWESLDPRVATVSATGLVSAISVGTTYVTAHYANVIDTTEIEVRGKPSHIAANSVDLAVGRTARLSFRGDMEPVNVSRTSGARITWSSTNPSIARVDSTGLVSATAVGNTAVVRIIGSVIDTTFVRVVSVAVASVALDVPNALTIGVGEAYPMNVVTSDGAGETLSDRVIAWTSNDPNVADVSATGVVTGISSGTATITASSEGETDSRTVVVVPPRASVVSTTVLFGQVAMTEGQTPAITVGPWQVNGGAWGTSEGHPTPLKAMQTIQAAAIARGADGAILVGRNVIWSSLNPDVARVSSSGLVTAVGTGVAALRATVETSVGDGPVTIEDGVVASVVVTLGTSSLTPGQATQAVAVARDANGSLLTGRAVVWTSLDPHVATVSPIGIVTGVSGGSTTIRATVETKTGDAPVSVTAPATSAPTSPSPDAAGDAEFPRVYLETGAEATPSLGKTIRVAGGEDLQHALDVASPGDRISLECGATFTGNFRLEAKNDGGSTGWITVQSECSLPAPGTRTSPSQSFAKLVSPNILPVIMTLGAADRWRIVGVEITTAPQVSTNQGLIAIGCTHACETSLADQPSDIIFDRVYIHGTTELDVRRCIGLNGARLAVVDSYVSECHSGFDAQAVSGWNGPGPFKITNNYLEGAAENISFGGADPSIPGLIPSDIEIRHNHVVKPMSWKGSRWLIKNSIEFKVGRRVLIDGNVIENSWPHGQAGFAFVLWSVNQQTTCPTCVTEHLTIQNNVIRSVAAGFNLDAIGGYTAIPMNHVVIRNNVFVGLDNESIGGNGRLFQISNIIPNLTIEHNTGFSPSNSSFIWSGNLPLPNHIVRDNLVGGGQYQLFTPWGQGMTAWEHAAGPGSLFAGNVVAAFVGGQMIPGNLATGSLADLGLVGGPGAATSAGATVDDLALQWWSGYAKKATDGTDPGANIAAIKAATANVVRQ